MARSRANDPNQQQLDLGDQYLNRPLAAEGDNVYFAMLPDPMTAARIGRYLDGLKTERGFVESPRPARVLHISLCPLGLYQNLSLKRLDDAMQAASLVRHHRFDIALDRLISFGSKQNPSLVFAGDDGTVGVSDLYEALRKALARLRPRLSIPKAIKPHLTGFYRGAIPKEILLESPFKWTAHEFVLVRSCRGQSRLEPLGSWPLIDPSRSI
ncbi:MAG TPA: 2'-5' RNA ligase family protein [Aliidongia sp.]|uniref:2'-5' RNA ligase family protein n=1 Tax=Aliidongia sp. TaxID=1914230 RepID=UPI002DDD892D|nr:2'-5' RNA ligase family protein [Aliidongia sp.]HEV2678671.1 2'-5' RNA ligase family protein [Aliidongia sp.]